jgi:hypothetical protein
MLEFDFKMEEAESLRKKLPLMRTKLDLADKGRLALWQGGLPQPDALLGARHLSAQTVIPQTTVELLKARERAREEAARAPPPDTASSKKAGTRPPTGASSGAGSASEPP